MTSKLAFRWLGVQGVELRCGEQTLAIDPFFTRPSLGAMLRLRRIQPDRALMARCLPACNFILVTHSHYDHLMDVPDLALQTGALVIGSANTVKVLALSGVPGRQSVQVEPGMHLSLGLFEVEVFANRHIALPTDPILNGPLNPNLRLPLRQVDYRMDRPFGYYIRAAGVRILFCPGPSHPADILFAGVDWKAEYYRSILLTCHPHLFVPLHWDNFFRPLGKPLQELSRPAGTGLKGLARLTAQAGPATKFLVPQLFQWVDL